MDGLGPCWSKTRIQSKSQKCPLGLGEPIGLANEVYCQMSTLQNLFVTQYHSCKLG